MEKSSAKFSLRLLIDEKRNKVVLAETCRDFIDILFSLLTLPMGTIVRLLQKHHKLQPVIVGCFNNLYTSVSDMVVDDFETEACRSMLLFPRSTKEIHCRRLKLNIDDTEATKFFTCTSFYCGKYNNFNSSRCSCGDLMTRQFQVPEEEQIGGPIRNGGDGVFVSCRSSYIVTDDLKVTLSSLGVIVNVMNGLGYASFDDLQEILLDVGFEEVLTLLGNLFVSEFPMTCTFLRNPFKARDRVTKGLSTHARKVEHIKDGNECYVKLFVRKFDRKILYAECGDDFIDNLLSFLVLPLELAWSLSNDSTILGCVGNLCQSECRGALASTPWEIPYYYTFSKQILDIPPQPSVEYKYILLTDPRNIRFARQFKNTNCRSVTPTDPKLKSGTSSMYGSGFVKRDTKFIVSDDLVITPMGSSSTIGLFMKSNINISDLEEQRMSISEAELISILRASLVSRCALTNGLSNMLAKNPKKQVLGVL